MSGGGRKPPPAGGGATTSSGTTAGGTLVLAFATFGATHSANRAARTAERAFEARLRPVLVQSRREDPVEKIMWGDRHWSRVPGGQAWVEVGSDAVYLAMSVRNVGAGMAVIHGWHADPELLGADGHAPLDAFHDVLPSEAPSPEDAVVERDARRRLERAVLELPLALKLTVTLALEGFTPDEVATVLGISTSAAAVRLHRAKAALQERLEDRCT